MSRTAEQAMELVEIVVEQITKTSELNPKYVRDTILSTLPPSPSEHFGLEELRIMALEYLHQLYKEEFDAESSLN